MTVALRLICKLHLKQVLYSCDVKPSILYTINQAITQGYNNIRRYYIIPPTVHYTVNILLLLSENKQIYIILQFNIHNILYSAISNLYIIILYYIY